MTQPADLPFDTVPLSQFALADGDGAGWTAWRGFDRFRPGQMSAPPSPLLFVEGAPNTEWCRHAHDLVATVPPLGLTYLRDAEVTGHGYAFVDRRLVVDGSHLSNVSMEWIARDAAAGQDLFSRPIRTVSEPVLLACAPGYPIYGHWLADLLPRAAIARDLLGERFEQLRILLPSDTPAWVFAMIEHCLRPSREQFLLFDRDNEVVRCERLCVPSYAHSGDYFFHAYVREFYDRYVGSAARTAPRRKLCLSRRNFERETRGALKRLENRELFEAAAVRSGFDLICPEEFSFPDQIALFASAEAIVGEFGSGLHNSVFSPPGTVVAAIRMPNAIQSRLGAAFEQPCGYLIPDREWLNELNGESYSVTPAGVDALFRRIDEALTGQTAPLAGASAPTAAEAPPPGDHLSIGDPRHVLNAPFHLALGGEAVAAAEACRSFVEAQSPRIAANTVLLNAVTELAFQADAPDAIARYIELTYGVPARILIAEDGAEPSNPGVALWTVSETEPTCFTFSAALSRHSFKDVILKNWVQDLPLFLHYARLGDRAVGTVALNLEDLGGQAGLAYCDHRPEFHLIPDPVFMQSKGYIDTKAAYDRSGLSWEHRTPVAFWRGSTTGWLDVSGAQIRSWRDLPRVKLCGLADTPRARGLLDARLTSVAQVEDPVEYRAAASSALFASHTDWRDFQRYKYQVDIDGNTSSWPGLMMKLCSGSAVLKVASPLGFRQWYYDRLAPWYNYVPVAADMSDLLDKVSWLQRRDEVARTIGENGRRLAESMTIESELLLSERAVAAAFEAAGSGAG